MNDCFICKKPLGESRLRTVKARGMKRLLDRAVAKNDEDSEQLLRSVSEITAHESCYLYYNDDRTDNAFRRRRSNSTSSSISDNAEPDFDFANNCFICAESLLERSPVSKKQKRRVCHVRSDTTKDSVMNLINHRTDEFAMGIANRIAHVPSLVDVGAQYHHACSKHLHSRKLRMENLSDGSKDCIDEAMNYVFSYLHDNNEECQFFLTDLMKSIKGEYVPDKRTVMNRLKEKYKDEIMFFNKSGHECIVCFKGFIYNVVSKKPSHKQKDVRENRLQIIRDAAAIILEDIRSQPYDTNQYPPADDFLKNVNSVVPETLSTLLSEIICKCKRKSLDAAQRKSTSIAHSIIAATRPASFVSPVLLGVGSFLYKKYGSSNLIDVLSSLGFSASYNSICLFEDSCAFRRPRNVLPHAFSQFVFDNADFNSNTIDGKNTFHAMGGIQCITPYDGIEADSSLLRVSKRIPAGTKSTLGLIPLVAYSKAKTVGLGKINVSLIENITLQTEKIVPTPCDLMWLYGKWSCTLNMSGWNSFMIEATASKPFTKSRILCLPFINAPPTDYNTILTSLLLSIDKCKASNQKTCIVTFDQPLYWKARDIIAAADPNTELSKVVIRLGGFHLLMSFIGAIGYIMSGSGLEDIFRLIYAENCVHHIMSGHAYGRAVRAHLLVHTSITKIIMDSIEFTAEERDFLDDAVTNIDRTSILEAIKTPLMEPVRTKFEEALSTLESNGATTKLWVQYYRLVTLMKHFIEAERSGNWPLHLETIRKMLPIFHASGHFLYAKSSHLYLQDMLNLDKIMTPEEFHSFTDLGCFTIRRTDKFWSGIMSDQTIEQTLMKMFKSSGGLTHGRGITETTLASWTLGMIRLQDICEQVTNYCNISMDTSEQHVDFRDSRIKRDNEDLEKIDDWFASHDFTLHRSELICIANGIVASENINCHHAFEIGEELIRNIIGSDFQHLSFQRKSKVLSFSAMTSTIEVEKSQVVINPLLLFQRMCISRERIGDIKQYLGYELAPYPLSLFSDDGMRKGTKSSLFNAFIPMEQSSHISTRSHFIVDGGFLLHKVVWDQNSSFNDITGKYIKFIQEHFGLSASVIFDGYSDDPDIAGTKSWERLRRTKKQKSTELKFDKCTVPTLSQDKFLGNEKNKANFIELLKTSLSEVGFNVDQAESDADTLIVRSALAASQSFDSVTVVAEDIDILVLLTALGRRHTNVFFLKPSKGRVGEQLYSASSFMYEDVIADNLLFLHAFSGCDTTSAAYNIGKIKYLTTLQKNLDLASAIALFSNQRVDRSLLSAIGERFFIAVYGGNKDDSLDSLRYKRFTKSVAKNSFSLSSLPPTQDTARLHSFRVYHQVQSWLGNNNDPEDWGWKKYGQIFMPVQSSKPPAPPELLKLIFCRCKGNCGDICGCRKTGLKCSGACLHCSGETCSNTMNVMQLIDENVFEDELPTMTPVQYPTFLDDTVSEAEVPEIEVFTEPQPGPSKKLRTQ